MQRRKFSREFKIEAVKLVRERGVSVAQAGRDLGIHENVLRKWVKEFGSDPVQGSKPPDMPVVQSTKFQLVINMQTARTLGIAVPQSLQVAADELIE